MTAIDAARIRTGRLLFGGAALGATGWFAGLAAAPLAAEDLTGGVTWSGLPGAMGITGTAIGAGVVGLLLRRFGRRNGLAAGYLVGAVGALLAVLGIRAGSFPLLLLGAATFGIGQAANQLTRYVVAELHEPLHRGRALGWIVWAGTIGGVLGPSLLAPSGRVADGVGLPELAGPYAVGIVAMGVLALGYQLLLRPDPRDLAVADELDDASPEAAAPVSAWRLPVVRVSLTVMVTGQVVMVWLMSMTPVHIRASGGDLTRIGLILAAHVFGMYALAPVAGWVEDRFGSLTTIATALTTLALSAVLAAVAAPGGLLMGAALLLLGIGWCFGFVAGSTMLARGVDARIRTVIQSRVETIVWLSSAVASLGAGLLLDRIGYVGLCVLALIVLVLPTTFVVRQRSRLSAEATPAARR